MSVESRSLFLQALYKTFGSEISADDRDKVLDIISAELTHYNLERIQDLDNVNEAFQMSQDMLNAFLTAKEIEGRSVKTIERYRYIINRLVKNLNVPINQINVYHLRSHLLQLKKSGNSDSTLEGIREVYSSFFGWLYKEGFIKANPVTNLAPIKTPKKIRHILTDVDIEKLKEAASSDRDRAIMCLLQSTGCRISEITQLNRDSIDFDKLECKIHGKGNKERIVYLNEVTAMYIKRYLDKRKDTSIALFAGKGSARLTSGGIRNMLNQVADRANVNHVHPHKFRRTLATNLITHGMSIQEVAQILGHDKLDTTMEYIVLDNQTVKNNYKKYS